MEKEQRYYQNIVRFSVLHAVQCRKSEEPLAPAITINFVWLLPYKIYCNGNLDVITQKNCDSQFHAYLALN